MDTTQQGDILMDSVTEVPATAKRVEVVEGRYMIAHGESGNQHVLMAEPGMDLWDDGGTLYLTRRGSGGVLTHEGPSRHHLPVVLPEGPVVRFRKVREFDHLAQMSRPVMD